MPPINENSEAKITFTIYSNYDNSKIFNLSNIKHNTIEFSQKVFYTSIHGFLPHQLCHPSVHTTFRLSYVTSKRTVRNMLKVIVRHYQASLKTTLCKTISLSNKLRRNNFNAVNQLLPKVSRKEALRSVSFLVTFRRNKFPETIRLIVKRLVFFGDKKQLLKALWTCTFIPP